MQPGLAAPASVPLAPFTHGLLQVAPAAAEHSFTLTVHRLPLCPVLRQSQNAFPWPECVWCTEGAAVHHKHAPPLLHTLGLQ